MVKEITDNNFRHSIKEGNTIVYFWASWCTPCRHSAPLLEEFAANNPEIKAVKINIDDYSVAVTDMGVRSVPTFILFKDGEEVARHAGALRKDTLTELCKNVN